MEVNLNPFLPGESRLPSWFGLWSPTHSKCFLACAQCCSGTEQIASTHSSSLTSTIPSFNARTLNDRIFEHKHIPFGQQQPATTASGQANKIHLICHQSKLRTTTQPFATNVEIKFELIQTGNRQVKNKKPSKMRKPNVLVVFGQVSNFCELPGDILAVCVWLNKMKLEVEIDWRTSLPSPRLRTRWMSYMLIETYPPIAFKKVLAKVKPWIVTSSSACLLRLRLIKFECARGRIPSFFEASDRDHSLN